MEMIKFIKRLFNTSKAEELEKLNEVYRERNEQLEGEVRALKDYKLKYEITKMIVDDDEAILELLECKSEKLDSEREFRVRARNNLNALGGLVPHNYGRYGTNSGMCALGLLRGAK